MLTKLANPPGSRETPLWSGDRPLKLLCQQRIQVVDPVEAEAHGDKQNDPRRQRAVLEHPKRHDRRFVSWRQLPERSEPISEVTADSRASRVIRTAVEPIVLLAFFQHILQSAASPVASSPIPAQSMGTLGFAGSVSCSRKKTRPPASRPSREIDKEAPFPTDRICNPAADRGAECRKDDQAEQKEQAER